MNAPYIPQVEKVLTYVFWRDAALPKEELNLADGLFLAPLPPFLLEKDDDYCVQRVEPRFSRFFRESLHPTTLNVPYHGSSQLNFEGEKSPEGEAYRKGERYFLAAMIHEPGFVVPYAYFVTIPTQQRVCDSTRVLDFVTFGEKRPLSMGADEFAAIDGLYEVLSRVLGSGSTGRIGIAATYYQQAFRDDVLREVRFLGMMMAMETLFSHGASEVSHQVSERVAFFLSETALNRETTYDQMRKLYKLRSTIAHGGTPTGTQENLTQSFSDLLYRLRDCLVRILTDPTTLSIFQSAGSKQLNRAMARLVFRGQVSVDGCPPRATGQPADAVPGSAGGTCPGPALADKQPVPPDTG